MNEQADVKPNEQESPDSADTGDQDIENILNEYEQQADKKPDPAPQKPEVDTELKQKLEKALAYIDEQQNLKIRETTDKDVSQAVKDVFGESDLSDEIKQDLIFGRFARNQRYLNVWNDRHNNPQAFKALLGSLTKEYKALRNSEIDQEATRNREQVGAAVRQSQPAKEETSDLGKKALDMNDSQFSDFLRKAMNA